MMNNLMQMVNQLKSNPMQMILQSKLNVPQNLMNDPNAIINHLLQTGQVKQEQINNAYQIAQKMGLRR